MATAKEQYDAIVETSTVSQATVSVVTKIKNAYDTVADCVTQIQDEIDKGLTAKTLSDYSVLCTQLNSLFNVLKQVKTNLEPINDVIETK